MRNLAKVVIFCCAASGVISCKTTNTDSGLNVAQPTAKKYTMSSGCSHHSSQYAVEFSRKNIRISFSETTANRDVALIDLASKDLVLTRRVVREKAVETSSKIDSSSADYIVTLEKSKKVLDEMTTGNGCTKPAPELAEASKAVGEIILSKSQTFAQSSGCSHHSTQYSVRKNAAYLEVKDGTGTGISSVTYILQYSDTRGLTKRTFSAGGASAKVKNEWLYEEQDTKAAFKSMLQIVKAVKDGNACSTPKAELDSEAKLLEDLTK